MRPVFQPWQKDQYQNLVAKIPSDVVIDDLARNFFTEANWYFMVLEEYYFKSTLSNWLSQRQNPTGLDLDHLPRELHYFSALLCQVLAISLQILPPATESSRVLGLDDFDACDKMSLDYSTMGVDIIRLLGRNNSTLDGVHHDLLRCVWIKNCSRGTEAWYSLGDAIRCGSVSTFSLQQSTK